MSVNVRVKKWQQAEKQTKGWMLLCLLWVRVLQKKQPSYEIEDHRRYVAPVPQFNVVLWIMCLAAFKKNSHFCSWCSALPSTTLKLGVAGVMYVSMLLFADGCFFWRYSKVSWTYNLEIPGGLCSHFADETSNSQQRNLAGFNTSTINHWGWFGSTFLVVGMVYDWIYHIRFWKSALVAGQGSLPENTSIPIVGVLDEGGFCSSFFLTELYMGKCQHWNTSWVCLKIGYIPNEIAI